MSMKTKFLTTILTCICVVAFSAAAAGQEIEDREIRDLQTRQADAWNRHDATAYANLFTEVGEVVNVVGWWWKGRSQIESRLTDAFAFVFRDSRMTITDVQTRHLAPGLAIAHVLWTMAGVRTPPGIPEPREGIQIQVLKKVDGKWFIYSFQNTNRVPERPFPRGLPPGVETPKQ
jgi:uncharacterized protein (TIGR02246 family)